MPTGPQVVSGLDSGLAVVVDPQVLRVPVVVLAQVLVAVIPLQQTRDQAVVAVVAPQQVRLVAQVGQAL
jgi:hypothetical protein